jgi:fructose-1-phosphate kinase PfkB-like protein
MKISSEKEYIFVIGPNPAWQKTLFFDNLLKGEINRASRCITFPAGKGVNFCKATTRAGSDCLLFQFAGGRTGEMLSQSLEKLKIPHITIKPDSILRTCTTCLCLESSEMTELIEPAGEVTDKDVDKMLEKFTALLSQCRGVALCGTVPPGAEELYVKLTKIARENNLPVIYDAWQNTQETLQIGVEILKINREELAGITGMPEVADGIQQILKQFPVKVVAITDGPGAAYIGYADKFFSLGLPLLDKVINPLGCGDTASGVMFSRYLDGELPENAFAAALAAASANCLTEKCAEFDPVTAAKILSRIVIS